MKSLFITALVWGIKYEDLINQALENRPSANRINAIVTFQPSGTPGVYDIHLTATPVNPVIEVTDSDLGEIIHLIKTVCGDFAEKFNFGIS